MNCPDVRPLLSAHLDEELDVVNDAAVASHLENCPTCAAAALALADQRRRRQEKLTRHRAPAELAAQIRAALPPASRVTSAAVPWWPGWSRAVPLAAGMALALLAGFSWGGNRARANALAGELTAAHVRARLTGHVIDVASSDRHTVKPWFANKVDFAPFVPDLAAQGFPLAGGRLERLGGRTVATLVYSRRQHSIDLHVWSGGPAPVAAPVRRDGYALVGWRSGDLNYSAVSDVAPEELAAFASLFQAAR
ncbi:MAG: anti-sigma factor [Opitutae bacterium]|nr:anti-sigma factor [Opitutae bacterium]